MIMLRLLSLACAVLCASALRFTGDVAKDFTPENGAAFPLTVLDGDFSDVGLPPQWLSPYSGWDMQSISLSYDAENDALSIGIDW